MCVRFRSPFVPGFRFWFTPSPGAPSTPHCELPLPTDDETSVLEELSRAPALLAEIEAGGESELALQQRLRKTYPDALVRAALSLVELRRRGRAKFVRSDRMWFDRVGLEQATPEPVGRHKANRFATAPSEPALVDLCCGIGADACQMAQHRDVFAVDRRTVAAWRTARNAAVYDVAGQITTHLADVTTVDVAGRLVHIDPDRRTSGRKVVRIEESEPGLEFLEQLVTRAAGGAIKLSPAANFGGKFPEAEVELVSLNGECKEATIWFGALRGETQFRATVLTSRSPGDLENVDSATLTGDPWSARGPVVPLGRYLLDPDPAVVRAGLVDVCSETLSIGRLDPEEEYLTSDELPPAPFVTPFEVVADLSNNDREIRSYFRESQIGQVEIKCRHVPVDVEAFRKKLPLPGREAAVLLFARVSGRTRAIVARRVPRAASCLPSSAPT